MRALRRRHANQHLRAKNEKAGGKETGRLHHVAGEWHQPQAADRQQNPGGENQVHRPAIAVKQLIRAPARHQRADKTAYLEHGNRRIRRDQIDAERFRHIEIAPVVNRCAHYIYQHVAQREQPDIGIQQHVFSEDLFAGQPYPFLLLGNLQFIVTPVAYCGQPYRLRPVAQPPAEKQPGEDRQHAGNHHSRSPAVVQRRRANHHRDQRPADVMRRVPQRPPAAAFGTRIPGRQQTRAHRRPPALEEGVQGPQQREGPQRSGKAKQDIHYAGGDQTNPHKIASIRAVADDTGEKLR